MSDKAASNNPNTAGTAYLLGCQDKFACNHNMYDGFEDKQDMEDQPPQDHRKPRQQERFDQHSFVFLRILRGSKRKLLSVWLRPLCPTDWQPRLISKTEASYADARQQLKRVI